MWILSFRNNVVTNNFYNNITSQNVIQLKLDIKAAFWVLKVTIVGSPGGDIRQIVFMMCAHQMLWLCAHKTFMCARKMLIVPS